MKRLELIVSGVVQGVGFRYFCQKHAERMGIKGSVENQLDGTVRVEAQGDDRTLEEYIALIREGPRNATVLGVDQRPLPVVESEGLFQVR